MSGFNRRFSYFPTVDQIMQIEGGVIVSLPPAGSIRGQATGVVALVGEFADCTYGVAVDEDGTVTTSPQPVEIFSNADLVNKLGGWDETLGDFGASMGNGFVELRNKSFSRLVVVPINLAGGKGIRLWRELPTNTAADDALPVVPVLAAVVEAGRQFASAGNLVRLMQRVQFTASEPIASGVDADTTTQIAAATQSVTMASGDFVNDGVQEGDILVLGVT